MMLMSSKKLFLFTLLLVNAVAGGEEQEEEHPRINITPPVTLLEGVQQDSTLHCQSNSKVYACFWFLPDGAMCGPDGCSLGREDQVSQNSTTCSIRIHSEGREYSRSSYSCKLMTGIDLMSHDFDVADTAVYYLTTAGASEGPNLEVADGESIEIPLGPPEDEQEAENRTLTCSLRSPSSRTRFTWSLNHAVVKQEVIDCDCHSSLDCHADEMSARCQPSEVSDSIQVSLGRDDFPGEVSCIAQRLFHNGTTINPGADGSNEVMVKFDLLLAPAIIMVSVDWNVVTLLVEAHPPVRYGEMIDDADGQLVMAFICSDREDFAFQDIFCLVTTSKDFGSKNMFAVTLVEHAPFTEIRYVDVTGLLLVPVAINQNLAKCEQLEAVLSDSLNATLLVGNAVDRVKTKTMTLQIGSYSAELSAAGDPGRLYGPFQDKGNLVTIAATVTVLVSAALLVATAIYLAKRHKLCTFGVYEVVSDISETEL